MNFDVDSPRTRSYLLKIRIAFLMAWHPRLGANALIRNFVPKDVGRLIAQRYITLGAHSIVSPASASMSLLRPDDDFDVVFFQHQHCVPRTLVEVWNTHVIDPGIAIRSPLLIQSCRMTMPFGVKVQEGQRETERYSIMFSLSDDDAQCAPLISMLRRIDATVLHYINKQTGKRHTLKESLHRLKVSSQHHGFMCKIKDPTKVPVWESATRKPLGTISDLLQRNALPWRCVAKAIICLNSVLYFPSLPANVLFPQWEVKQLYLIERPHNLDECQFTLNDDNELA